MLSQPTITKNMLAKYENAVTGLALKGKEDNNFVLDKKALWHLNKYRLRLVTAYTPMFQCISSNSKDQFLKKLSKLQFYTLSREKIKDV